MQILSLASLLIMHYKFLDTEDLEWLRLNMQLKMVYGDCYLRHISGQVLSDFCVSFVINYNNYENGEFHIKSNIKMKKSPSTQPIKIDSFVLSLLLLQSFTFKRQPECPY